MTHINTIQPTVYSPYHGLIILKHNDGVLNLLGRYYLVSTDFSWSNWCSIHLPSVTIMYEPPHNLSLIKYIYFIFIINASPWSAVLEVTRLIVTLSIDYVLTPHIFTTSE